VVVVTAISIAVSTMSALFLLMAASLFLTAALTFALFLP
jgi:hypothetical protein